LVKGKFHENQKIVTGTLYEDQYIFFIVSRSVLLRMRNVSDKSCCSITVFENHPINEILWKNIVEPCRPQVTIWRMHVV
jgi:hypothetical protein